MGEKSTLAMGYDVVCPILANIKIDYVVSWCQFGFCMKSIIILQEQSKLLMKQQTILAQINVNHYMIDEDTMNLVMPGDLITSEEGFMNGHGTYRVDNKIHASVLGTVEITNKLIIVNPLKAKYSPQVGDIVVGRVHEISNKRWKIDIKASAFAFLSLNSTYIPEQRKKNEEDEFNMRKIMQEGDLIVAQVHSVNNDKTYNLHTRNPKYGRLQPGILVELAPRQIKRQKHHMISLYKLGIILGNNGNVYLSNFRRNQYVNPKDQIVLDKYNEEMYNSMSIFNNILKLFSYQGLQISELLLKELYQFVKQKGIDAVSIIQQGEVREQLLERVRERIPKRIQEISLSLKKN